MRPAAGSHGERTHEIGIRKAVGARRRTILMLFLMESVVLCLLGCLIGVILSYLVIYGMAGFLTGMDIVISVRPGAVLLAPPPMQRGEWVQRKTLIEESEKLRQRYRALAEKRGCFFADAGDWDVELLCDGVHFSPLGHAAFARGLAKALRECEQTTGSESAFG